ncbi:hypothetical protein [Novacetimonas pomaceti]|uniref:Uncharacterized protein n=1 Tax=Novacetimonas pomaceti TaxID=2021998 RepID=A0A318QI91_9PROT|nr:hypothetical protein [Novacetimonas pomaceti]MBV1832991.1 hypothetical protein [Novacetimonas pomaceti]PYD47836.1 hypothetical protein C3920_07830 [Novacetimonas pomaceti]PYD77231.1 hypothetical protein CFR71_01970 [Novacetimonas pomaceti]
MKASFPRLFFAIAALCGATFSPACARTAHTDAQKDPYGLWTGTLIADQGTCEETHAPSTFQVDQTRTTFTPADGSISLHGTPDAQHQHYHLQAVVSSPGSKPFPMVLEAHPQDDTIVGTYGTPRCRAHVVLRRPQ